MSAKARARQEAFVYLLILWVMGFAFLYWNVLYGIAFMALAFLATMYVYPPFSKAVKTVVRSVVGFAQKQQAKKQENSASTQTASVESTEGMDNPQLEQIISELKTCPLPSRLGKNPEHDTEVHLEARLQSRFPNIMRQEAHHFSRFDIAIGNIGIEIKLPRNAQDMATLRGQMDLYLKYFKYVIAYVVLFSYIPREMIDEFRQDMSQKSSRITVIVRSYP